MDDPNQTNQPLDTSLPLTVPTVPEDITPQSAPPASVPEPVPFSAPQTETPAPMNVPSPVPMTPPAETTPSSPWASPAPSAPVPVPSVPTPMPGVQPPSPTEPTASVAEMPMPSGKPKKKIMPIIGGIVALLLVVGVAGAAYYVSNQLSTRQAVAPNAPESEPLAAACGSGDCKGPGQYMCGNGTMCCTGGGCPSYACSQREGTYSYISGAWVCKKSDDTVVDVSDSTCNACLGIIEPTTTTGESSSSLSVSKPSDGCNSTSYHKYDCGTQCCRTVKTYEGGVEHNNKDANCCFTGCKEPDSGGAIINTEEDPTAEQRWCDSNGYGEGGVIDKFQEASEITFKRAGLAKLYFKGEYNFKVNLTKISGDGPATLTIPTSGYSAGNAAYEVGNVTANSKYSMKVTLKEDIDIGRTASLGWRKPKSVQTDHPSCDATAAVTAAKAAFTLKEDVSDVDYPVMCWADSITAGGPAQSEAEKYDFDDFVVAVGYASECVPTGWGACSVSCGGGTQTDNCGSSQVCNTQACPEGVACMLINIYKKVGGAYGTTPLNTTELQALKVGDVLRLTLNSNTDNLKGRFMVSPNGTAVPWLDGTIDATNKKLVFYNDYTVAVAGTYTFNAEISTAP